MGKRRRGLLDRTIHDLKNPLAVVRASLEWLEVEVGDRPDALDAVRDASSATARLLQIVDDLDVLAQVEAGRPMARIAVDIGEIVAKVRGSFATHLALRSIGVVSIAPATIAASADPRLLMRSIEGLVDATARGASAGASIEIETRIASLDGKAATAIEIEIGLAGAVATGSRETSLDDLAAGGLSVHLAQTVIEAHGGTLRIVTTKVAPRYVLQLPC